MTDYGKKIDKSIKDLEKLEEYLTEDLIDELLYDDESLAKKYNLKFERSLGALYRDLKDLKRELSSLHACKVKPRKTVKSRK